MKEKNEMQKVTAAISNYRGLLISNRFLAVLMLIVQIFVIVKGSRNYSATYICILDLLMPIIIEGFYRRQGKTGDDDSLPLPLLRSKYKFASLKNKALSISFLLSVLLIATWRYSYISNPPADEMLVGIPVIVMIAYVGVRLVIWLLYLALFKWFPTRIMK